MLLFRDRRDAGLRLAHSLIGRENGQRPELVFALVRGGVPVADEIARALQLPLDVVVVRKLGAPDNPEFGIGAIAEEDIVLLHDESVCALNLEPDALREMSAFAAREIKRRTRLYRSGNSPLPAKDRNVLLVDDGLATGVSASAAIAVLRKWGARKITLAVPVGAPDTVEHLSHEADEVLCLVSPDSFFAVGTWYQNFRQVTDEEVVRILEESSKFRKVIPA